MKLFSKSIFFLNFFLVISLCWFLWRFILLLFFYFFLKDVLDCVCFLVEYFWCAKIPADFKFLAFCVVQIYLLSFKQLKMKKFIDSILSMMRLNRRFLTINNNKFKKKLRNKTLRKTHLNSDKSEEKNS